MKTRTEMVLKLVERINRANDLIIDLINHLDYCGWGDSYERECSESLRSRTFNYVKKEGLEDKVRV